MHCFFIYLDLSTHPISSKLIKHIQTCTRLPFPRRLLFPSPTPVGKQWGLQPFNNIRLIRLMVTSRVIEFSLSVSLFSNPAFPLRSAKVKRVEKSRRKTSGRTPVRLLTENYEMCAQCAPRHSNACEIRCQLM